MERLDIIDTDGNLTGETRDRKAVHELGLLHHASGVIILSADRSGGGVQDIVPTKILSKREECRALGHVCKWTCASGRVSA